MSDDIVDRLRKRERLRDSTRMLRLSTRLLLDEAADEIERLRGERDALKNAARNYLEVVGGAMKTGDFHMGGTRDMAHFVRSSMQKLDSLAFDRDEKRPSGLERLHDEIVKGKERLQG
jgi:hypothetical protein